MTVVGFIVTGVIQDDHLSKGNPIRLTNAIDYDGRICGYGDGVENRPNAYYMVTGAVVCVKKCPGTTDYTKFFCYDDDQPKADNSTTKAWQLVGKSRCMYKAKTKECMTNSQPTK